MMREGKGKGERIKGKERKKNYPTFRLKTNL